MKFNKLLSPSAVFDIIDRVEGIAFNWLNGDWQQEKKKHGWWGVLKVFWGCLTEQNIWEFEIDRVDSVWSGIAIERLLKRNGIKLGNRGVFHRGERYFFWTKRRQAKWAEYVMLRNGIQVTGKLFKPSNLGVVNRYAQTDRERDPSKLSKWKIKK